MLVSERNSSAVQGVVTATEPHCVTTLYCTDMFVDCLCGGRTVARTASAAAGAMKQEMERRLLDLAVPSGSSAELERNEALEGASAAELHCSDCPLATEWDLLAVEVVRLIRSVCTLRCVFREQCAGHGWLRAVAPEEVESGEAFDVCLKCSDFCLGADDEVAFVWNATSLVVRSAVTCLRTELHCKCHLGL
jgi:hypothetical protein